MYYRARKFVTEPLQIVDISIKIGEIRKEGSIVRQARGRFKVGAPGPGVRYFLAPLVASE